jgi:hypothetical protein
MVIFRCAVRLRARKSRLLDLVRVLFYGSLPVLLAITARFSRYSA